MSEAETEIFVWTDGDRSGAERQIWESVEVVA